MILISMKIMKDRDGGSDANKIDRRASIVVSTIEAFLIKPVQRITKYPLLLRAIMDQLPAKGNALRGANVAVKNLQRKFKVMLDRVNSSAKVLENMQKMAEMNDKLRWGEWMKGDSHADGSYFLDGTPPHAVVRRIRQCSSIRRRRGRVLSRSLRYIV